MLEPPSWCLSSLATEELQPQAGGEPPSGPRVPRVAGSWCHMAPLSWAASTLPQVSADEVTLGQPLTLTADTGRCWASGPVLASLD